MVQDGKSSTLWCNALHTTHRSLLTLCSLQVRHFFIRLPIVTHEASPWYPYLLAVYHTVFVALPFDLRTLGLRSKVQGLYSRPQSVERPKSG